MDKATFSLIFISIGYVLFVMLYYFIQNKYPKYGGKISLPKVYWLGLAMYAYYVVPPWAYIHLGYQFSIRFIFSLIMMLTFGRMVIQLILMYGVKYWIPQFGIVFNILFFGASIIGIVYCLNMQEALSGKLIASIGYASLFAFLGLVDSFYAFQFYKMVGFKTTGNAPIWFASDGQKFRKINRITSVNNILLTILLLTSLYYLILYNG